MNLFDYDEFYYISTGMYQLKIANLLATDSHVTDEPANYSVEVINWLSENKSEGFDNPLTGVPTFKFPSDALRSQFMEHFKLK